MSALLPQVDRLHSKPAEISLRQKAASTRSAVPDFTESDSTTTGSSSFAAQLKSFLDRTQDKTPAKTGSSKADKRRVSRDNTDPAATRMQVTVIPVPSPTPSPTPAGAFFAGYAAEQQISTKGGLPVAPLGGTSGQTLASTVDSQSLPLPGTPGDKSNQFQGDQAAPDDRTKMPAPQAASIPPSTAIPQFSEDLRSDSFAAKAQQAEAAVEQRDSNSQEKSASKAAPSGEDAPQNTSAPPSNQNDDAQASNGSFTDFPNARVTSFTVTGSAPVTDSVTPILTASLGPNAVSDLKAREVFSMKQAESAGGSSTQAQSSANLPAESTGDAGARRSADESLRAAQDASSASPAADVLAASAVSVAPSPAISRLTRHSEKSPRSHVAGADTADSARVKEAFQNALNSSLGKVPTATSKMEQNSAQRAVVTNAFAAQRVQSLHTNKSQTPLSEAATAARTTRNSGAPAGPGSGRIRQGNPSNGPDSASKAETARTMLPAGNSSDAESATDSVRTSSDGQPNPPSSTPANVPGQSPVTGNPAAQERGLAAWDNMDARAGRIVNAASLAAQPDHVEMRMDVRTEKLGALEIHAVLERGRLGASISAETPEARSILASHLPSLEQSLSDRHVHMENIVISNHPTGSESTLAGGSDTQGRGNQQGSPGNRGNGPWSPEKISSIPEQSESDAWDSEGPWRKLSVRA